jgi:hypothetical protein
LSEYIMHTRIHSSKMIDPLPCHILVNVYWWPIAI